VKTCTTRPMYIRHNNVLHINQLHVSACNISISTWETKW